MANDYNYYKEVDISGDAGVPEMVHVFQHDTNSAEMLHINVTHPLINMIPYRSSFVAKRTQISRNEFLEYRNEVLRAFDLV